MRACLNICNTKEAAIFKYLCKIRSDEIPQIVDIRRKWIALLAQLAEVLKFRGRFVVASQAPNKWRWVGLAEPNRQTKVNPIVLWWALRTRVLRIDGASELSVHIVSDRVKSIRKIFRWIHHDVESSAVTKYI